MYWEKYLPPPLEQMFLIIDFIFYLIDWHGICKSQSVQVGAEQQRSGVSGLYLWQEVLV